VQRVLAIVIVIANKVAHNTKRSSNGNGNANSNSIGGWKRERMKSQNDAGN